MKTPVIPITEDTRLETLRALKILDTPPEERFDRLTRIAKRTFNVKTALVSLVDENRQWFKSSIGLDVRETPRDISFCGHAINSDDVFIVPNALEDERFADNPLVKSESWIRFYAGCPLKAMNGEMLGTFCIIDYEAREISKEDIEVLKDLASMAERELCIVHLATNDDLTKIANRRGFMLLAQNTLEVCIQHGFSASLVYLDINNFKSINDTFGHNEGDKVLIEFANMLKDSLRVSDVLARVGDDEFVVMLGNKNVNQAEESVKRFQKLMDVYNKNARKEYKISFSHGVVEYNPCKHTSIKTIMTEADRVMYLNKNENNNVFQIDSPRQRISG